MKRIKPRVGYFVQMFELLSPAAFDNVITAFVENGGGSMEWLVQSLHPTDKEQDDTVVSDPSFTLVRR
jgi:hypothetical protein